MADSNNDSTLVEEKEKDSEMDTSTEEKVEEEEVSKENDDTKETEEEKTDAEESEEEEELPPGLLEQPLEIQGKREKRKVERLSAAMVPKSSEKKKIEIEEGSGVKLGDIAFIESKLNSTKAIDLKPLHRLLFQRIGAANEVKKNIRQFCGFTQPKESKEQEKRTTMLSKMHIPELKSICLVLGLERSGAKKDVVDRIMDFLISPDDKGVKVPKSKKAKRSSSKSSNSKKETKKGQKRKRAPKKETKKAESDDEDEDAGSLDDDEEEEEVEDNEKDISEKEEESESEDEAPKKKKSKTEAKKTEPKKAEPKKAEPKKKAPEKVNGKKEKAPAKKEAKKPSPKKKNKKDTISDDDLSDVSDSSEDEPISMLVKEKSPPSNDEIKELVEKILDGADLESVTMKTVVKEVYGKYPTFDLSDRKDFIKNTVREVIS